MRFMVLVKADAHSETGALPSSELMTAMGQYNQQLIEAGVMQAGEGLQPSSKGARLHFENGEVAAFDGPFEVDNGLIAGFWLWTAASLDEATEWAMKAPFLYADIEIRQIYEMEDFGNALTREDQAQETAQRKRLFGE